MVIADVLKTVNFSHIHPNTYSLCWDARKTSIFLSGVRVVNYPFMGLGEFGNITSSFPRAVAIRSAWCVQSRDDVHVTYAQAYTPLTHP